MLFVLQHDALVETRHGAQGLGQGGGRPTEHLLSLRNAHWAAEVVRVPRPDSAMAEMMGSCKL